MSLEGDHQLGIGHVLGAVAGGALGHQFGNGGGRMVAQVLGSLGGGYAGGVIQNKYVDRQPGQHITVTLASGVAVGVTQAAQAGLQVGDCVRIDGSGQTARVVRADCIGAQAAVAAPPPAPSQGDALRDELRERVRERMEAERAAAPAPAAAEPAVRPLGESQIRFGRIVRIDSVTLQGEHEVGLEGVMNGVSGAALGDPVPGGDGRAFADVANTLGSVSARTSEIKYASPQPGELISVKLDNGIAVGITATRRCRIAGRRPGADRRGGAQGAGDAGVVPAEAGGRHTRHFNACSRRYSREVCPMETASSWILRAVFPTPLPARRP